MILPPFETVLREAYFDIDWQGDKEDFLLRRRGVVEEDSKRQAWKLIASYLYDAWWIYFDASSQTIEAMFQFYSQILADTDPVAQLSYVERWPTRAFANGLWVAEKGPLRVFHSGKELDSDGLYAVRTPCRLPYLQPSFVHFCSPAGRPTAEEVRIYAHVTKSARAKLVTELFGSSAVRFPFMCKMAYVADRYDTFVLYCDVENHRAIAAELLDIVQRKGCQLPGQSGEEWFVAGTPRMTLPLCESVSLAQTPPQDEFEPDSFCSHRAGLVGAAIVDALEHRVPFKDWLSVVRRHYADAGLDFDRPWAHSLDVDTSGAFPFFYRREPRP